MLSNKNSREENRNYLKSILPMTKGFINWKESVGYKIEYEYYWYGNIYKGILTIGDCMVINKNSRVYINEFQTYICVTHLYKCKLGGMLNTYVKDFRYKIGETIKDILIIDREYKIINDKKFKFYKYKCLKCGNEDWTNEYNLSCNACCMPPKKIVLGINTIWDKARWMCDLGISEEDAKKYTPQSNQKIEVICPHCGNKKKCRISGVHNDKSIGCICSDGISYPEKFIYSVLKQLNLNFETQYSPKWIEGKRYDFYLLDYNCIIEVHGEQHYNYFGRGRSLEEEQENDKYKMELALNNGIENYIIIDCRKSELEWVKNNIFNSELNNMLDLSNINWLECEEFALGNLIKEVCNYWNKHRNVDNEDITTSDLTKYFKLSGVTIRKYLKYGTELGWCKYNTKEEARRNGKLNSKHRCKPVSQFLEGEFIKTYPSARIAEKQTGINHVSIGNCCRGEQKTAGGFVWKFA